MDERTILVFYLKEGRSKAIEAAQAEALTLLASLHPCVLLGGPLAEKGGVFWIEVSSGALIDEVDFSRLGYTAAVDEVVPVTEAEYRPRRPEMVRFKGKPFELARLYEVDVEETRKRDPDQRCFYLAQEDGSIRQVAGYRGDGSKYGKRALPVSDAQLLVNLVNPGNGLTLLDPFAGAGGIVQEAVRVGLAVLSIDIDPVLKPGLEFLGAKHLIGSASHLPFETNSIDSIASEPPYDRETEELIVQAFDEMVRVVKREGRIALLTAEWQAPLLRTHAQGLDVNVFLDCPIDRKGYPCHLFLWEKH